MGYERLAQTETTRGPEVFGLVFLLLLIVFFGTLLLSFEPRPYDGFTELGPFSKRNLGRFWVILYLNLLDAF